MSVLGLLKDDLERERLAEEEYDDDDDDDDEDDDDDLDDDLDDNDDESHVHLHPALSDDQANITDVDLRKRSEKAEWRANRMAAAHEDDSDDDNWSDMQWDDDEEVT